MKFQVFVYVDVVNVEDVKLNVSASLLVVFHACEQYKDGTERCTSIRNLDELVPPVYDGERWWYKLTQASRPPFPRL
jgi:hypothetical protein